LLGGSPRPVPKPAPEKPAADDSDDSDKDIVFDDLAEDRLLEDAVDVTEEEEKEEKKEPESESTEAVKEPSSDKGDEKDDTESKLAAAEASSPAEKDESKSPAPAVIAAPPPASPVESPSTAEKAEPEKPSPAAEKEPEAKATEDKPKSEAKTPASPPAEATKADKEEKKPAADEGKKSAPPKVEKKTPKGPEWKMPEVDKMLNPTQKQTISDEELRRRAEVIEQTLSSFGAPARVVEVNHGPVITQFGVEPDYIDGRGGKRVKVKVGKISALADDIALALAAPTIRIEAPVPGKGFVGIEVPNAEPSIVGLRDVMDTPEFAKIKSPLKMALGQDVSGAPICADLTSMPHLLIAGTTGSGKSVCVNGIICTMLMNMTPDELKMIMVDPKRVELTNYNGIPHLMAPVVTELERIVGVLKWVQREMDDRYRKFAMAGARNISDYNLRVEKGRVEDDRLPYILVIVDELADLMMLAPDETERVITRLAQMARATGIHIILSTQRPSVDVVTGLIKANFPSRIAFAVATGVDSRVILDMPGAEKLLGRGDMLFQAPDAPLPVRMQGVYLSDEEIDRIVQHWRKESDKMPDALKPGAGTEGGTSFTATQKPLFSTEEEKDDEVDDLYDEAVELVRDMEKASISLLQRHLRIGYTRAARLIEAMEERGIVGEHEGGSAPREVLDDDEE